MNVDDHYHARPFFVNTMFNISPPICQNIIKLTFHLQIDEEKQQRTHLIYMSVCVCLFVSLCFIYYKIKHHKKMTRDTWKEK